MKRHAVFFLLAFILLMPIPAKIYAQDSTQSVPNTEEVVVDSESQEEGNTQWPIWGFGALGAFIGIFVGRRSGKRRRAQK